MPRTAGIIALAVYASASCLIVSALGRAHRESLNAPLPEPEPVRAEAPAEVAQAPEPAPEPIIELVEAKVPDPQPPAPSPVEPKVEPAPTTAPVSKLVRPEEINLFFARSDAQKKWDLEKPSPADEVELGRLLHEMVMHAGLNRRFQDETMERRLLEAGEPIVKTCSRQDVNYTYHILDSGAVNAFSHPGGYIYVTRGLMDWISEDQEAALRFALAHEVRHVDHGDSIRCLRDPSLQAAPLGTLEAFFAIIIPRGHGRRLELEADAWALQQLRRGKALGTTACRSSRSSTATPGRTGSSRASPILVASRASPSSTSSTGPSRAHRPASIA